MDIVSVFEQFPTQDDCIGHIEAIRWPNGPVCPYCGSKRTTAMPKERRHHCNACNTSFSATVGTILHRTHLPLQKWFLALTLTLNARKGVSARQLACDLRVAKDTAWRIAMKIREAMAEVEQRNLLTGIVEADETYIGGKPRRRPPGNTGGGAGLGTGRGTPRIPVVGMVERGPRGRVKVEAAKKLGVKEMSALVRRNVDISNTILYTDEWTGYLGIKSFLPHETINHAEWYVDGDVHTNSIESFWALLKRGIVGQYHKVSLRYLPGYINEFSCRFNHRDSDDMFERTLARGLGVTQ